MKYLIHHLDRLSQAAKNHAITTFVLTISALYAAIEAWLQPISNDIAKDALYSLIFIALIVFLTNNLIFMFISEYRFAKNKLSTNSLLFGMRRIFIFAIVNILFLLFIFFLYYNSIYSIFRYTLPPYEDFEYCFRIGVNCRQCPNFADMHGQSTGFSCLNPDVAGLVTGKLSRWTSYRPAQLNLQCSDHLFVIRLNEDLDVNSCSRIP